MNPSFEKSQLLSLLKKNDLPKYKINIDDLKNNLDEIHKKIIDENYDFLITNNRNYFITNDLGDILVLRKLYDNIKKIYKDEQANRNFIINQIRILLSDTCKFWIIKTDIEKFYESINRKRILEKFYNDGMLSYYSLFLIRKLFKNLDNNYKYKGIPRGINISSLLSEIYMRKFDEWIKRNEGVYYYARYVDDIIIFLDTYDNAKEILKKINPELKKLAPGLKLNYLKTKLFDDGLKSYKLNSCKVINSNTLNHLGYSIRIKSNGNNNKDLSISLSLNKVKKIKSRIIKSFLAYSKNKNFKLLEKRIKFLTGNYVVRKNKNTELKAGIFYNYIYINELETFNKLNEFYYKVLFSKTKNFGDKIGLSPRQKSILKKYNFISGFKNKKIIKLSYQEMKEITNCW